MTADEWRVADRSRPASEARTAALKSLLYEFPHLQYLFLELTRQCNLRCKHCGSSCPSEQSRSAMTFEQIKPTLDEVAQRFSGRHVMYCITGGEPLLCPDWERICTYITSLGFSWGMTSNGTLIDEAMVERLARAGMKTVAISLDGLEATHDAFRGRPGAFRGAAEALRLLCDSGRFRSVQAITVVTPDSLAELEALYCLLRRLGVRSWKLTGVEPIGEARAEPALQLTCAQYRALFRFVQEKRACAPIEVTYGCAHYLPAAYEEAVRKDPFLCGAGTLIAGVTCEGDITACLDIDDRAHAVQGNIGTDSFADVWERRFERFRRNKALDSRVCAGCDRRGICHGDSWHTWDFNEQRPRRCLFRMLEGSNENG